MEHKPILRYDFTNVSSTIVPDVSGYGQAGVIRNFDKGGAVLEPASLFGRAVTCIDLPGGEGGGYLQAPDGALQNQGGLTVNLWTCVKKAHYHDFLFSFGGEVALYVRLSPDREDEDSGAVVLTPCVTTGGRSQERPAGSAKIDPGRWYMVTLTLSEEGRLAFYLDGSLQAEMERLRVLPSTLADAKECVFGTGVFAKNPSELKFADIDIFPTAFSAEEVQGLFRIPASGRVAADAEDLAAKIPAETPRNLSLPKSGVYGSAVAWESSDPAVLTAEGAVTRPAALSPDAVVTLTATLSYEDAETTRSFTVTVPAMPTDQQVVEADLAALTLPDLSCVIADVALPQAGETGSAFSWQSSDPSVFSGEGKVARPDGADRPFTLTVTAAYGTARATREFSGCVLCHYPVKLLTPAISVCVETAPGCEPAMPDRFVLPVEGGDPVLVFPQWEEIPAERYAQAGAFTVNGTCRAFPEAKFTAEVTVKEDAAPEEQGHFTKLDETALDGENVMVDRYHQGLRYLKMLDADRMLYNFRATFGQDTKGVEPPGGWDEPMGLLRGHSTGHFLSALALAYASSHDGEILDKLHYMVDELASLQSLSEGAPEDFVTACTPSSAAQYLWSKDPSTWGEGFLSAYSPDQFALLEQFTPYATIWAPYYTLHKILAGLLDCYRLAGSQKALDIAEGIGAWAYRRLSACTPEQRSSMWAMYIAGEYGGFNESMATLYRLTGKKEYLDTAAMFYNPKLFDGLIENHDTIAGLHANQHIPQIIGALEYYAATGEKKYYRIAEHFWERVTAHYAYSIGGVGRGELFKEPDILAGNIDTNRNCETCAAYNMLKLTLGLYAYHPEDVRYMDYFERTLLNQIVSSINPHETEDAHHGVTYMLPIGPGAHRHYSNDYHDFTCCHGTGMENHVKYQQGVYFLDEKTGEFTVNLYLPSHVHLEEAGIGASVAGELTGETFRVALHGCENRRVRLRKPVWCRETFTAEVPAGVVQHDGDGYLVLENLPHDAEITVHTPYHISLDPTPDLLDGQEAASVLYGPFVMVALSEDTETKTLVLKPHLAESFRTAREGSMPVLYSQGLKFVPMYAAHEVGYHVYFKIAPAF